MSERLCDCGCGRRFVPPADAPHKRFATKECRRRWHNQEDAKAKLALAAVRAEAVAVPTPLAEIVKP